MQPLGCVVFWLWTIYSKQCDSILYIGKDRLLFSTTLLPTISRMSKTLHITKPLLNRTACDQNIDY